jgi:hypothetical protein
MTGTNFRTYNKLQITDDSPQKGKPSNLSDPTSALPGSQTRQQ